ncbi:MAG: Wzz/FepE/Etk N-terminal domain-containing protein [Aggregatilineales bacterium]
MELRHYAQILVKRWWLIVPLTLIALTISLVISFRQPPVYQVTSTYVTRLDGQLGSIGDTLYGLDTLTARTSIFSTYCQVMTSQNVREDAIKLIGLDKSNVDLTPYTVNCNVLPDTNVLLLIVQGPSPTLTTRLNEAIGLAGMARSDSLYRFFGLQPLDPATAAPPLAIGNRLQIDLLGGILGLTVGISLAFALEYFRSPTERMDMLAIRDPQLGIYNKRYFQQRLAEEINRARMRNRPISVALLRLVPTEDFVLLPEDAQKTMARSAVMYMNEAMPELGMIASLGNMTFAILLPETPATDARNFIANLHEKLRVQLFVAGDYHATFNALTGLVEASGGALDPKSMVAKATEALQTAEESGSANGIELVRTSPMPFGLDDTSAPTSTVDDPFGSSPFVDLNKPSDDRSV